MAWKKKLPRAYAEEEARRVKARLTAIAKVEAKGASKKGKPPKGSLRSRLASWCRGLNCRGRREESVAELEWEDEPRDAVGAGGGLARWKGFENGLNSLHVGENGDAG